MSGRIPHAPSPWAAVGEQVGPVLNEAIERYLGSTAATLFPLMGAMTIVEVVDQNGGFNFVRDMIQTPHGGMIVLI